MKTLRSPRFWIGIIVSLVALWLAFRTVPFSELGNSLAQANILWIIPAILVQFLAVWARAQRWKVLLENKTSVTTAYWAHSIGFLFTNFLPFRMGEPARIIVMSERNKLPIVQVTASAMVERILDVATVVVGLAFVLPFMQVPALVSDAGLTFGVIVLICLVGLWLVVRFREQSDRLVHWILARIHFLPAQAIEARWGELVEGLKPITQPKVALLAVFWSIVAWFFSTCIYYFVMHAYQPAANWLEAIFIVVALALAITVPSSPGFIGVFQYVGQQALVLPFGDKYSMSIALAITLTSHLTYYIVTSALGVVGLWRAGESFSNIARRITTRKKESVPEEVE